jgi:tRNA-guanine family transglycosylase
MAQFVAVDWAQPIRLGRLETASGTIQTPAFVPFAANGAVGALTVADLERRGAQALGV